ncbi:hypothetical protein OVS_00825 [Mycoplasma ovis str. Michigan]|uniref:Uncharacterized protein n=1 Tax=Mycoplasma ovis str. Michigan TaxID=1415773 RepID=A0ABM5P140_9MOLU|nr:hypothetical protein [Mycoplasma ovis]AHC40153.1 hypothetical protein OVS_00825 [Mycoplasma ovis str. Michigan]
MSLLHKIFVSGGVACAPLTYIFSSFNGAGTLEIKDVSDQVGQTAGLKRVAILVNNKNRLKDGKAEISKICEGTSSSKHELVGLGILKEVNTNQVVKDGFIENALIPLGCVSNGGQKLEVVGNTSNFWYGVLDYENVIVELLSHGIDKTKTGKDQDQTVGWDGGDGIWKSEEAKDLEEFDKCYYKKLPQMGNILKRSFGGSKVEQKNIKLTDDSNCSNKKFGVSVINIYSKKGGWTFWPHNEDGLDWGQFNKIYGDRLSRVKIGDGKLMVGDNDIFNGFPRKINVVPKS